MNFFKKSLLIFSFFLTNLLFANQNNIDFNTLSKEIENTNKHIIVFFHMNYCPYCVRMKKTTLQNESVKKMIEKDFVFTHVNIDEKDRILFDKKYYTTKEFSKHLDIDFYPTTVFYNENKEIVYTARGHRKVDEFQKILRFIETKSYEDMDFFEYK